MCTTEKLLLTRGESTKCSGFSSSHWYHTGWLEWDNFSYPWTPAQLGLPTEWISTWRNATAAAHWSRVLGTSWGLKSVFFLAFLSHLSHFLKETSEAFPVTQDNHIPASCVWCELDVHHGSVRQAGFPVKGNKSFREKKGIVHSNGFR